MGTTPEVEVEVKPEIEVEVEQPKVEPVPEEELPTTDNGYGELKASIDSLPDKVAASLAVAIQGLRAEDNKATTVVAEAPVTVAPVEPVETKPDPANDESPAETHWYYRPLNVKWSR